MYFSIKNYLKSTHNHTAKQSRSGQTQPPRNVDCPLPHNSSNFLICTETGQFSFPFLFSSSLVDNPNCFLNAFFRSSLSSIFIILLTCLKIFSTCNLLTILLNYLNYYFYLTTTLISVIT